MTRYTVKALEAGIENINKTLTDEYAIEHYHAADHRTPHDTVKHNASDAGFIDWVKGRSCDSSRYNAKPGSAWDTWYTAGYRRAASLLTSQPERD